MSWVNEAIFYHIYPLGFCGAPRKNDEIVVPRIEKITEWIPHIKQLGINAVYLGPVFSSSEHGYDTKDYYQLDARLGENETFAQVCKALHENGIRIVLDGVFNHVGREFWAFKDVQKNQQQSKYCTWFHNLNFGGSSPLGDPFCYDGWGGHYSLVKLNLRNPEVVEHLIGAVDMWMREFGIDGLRLDAADCVDQDFFRRLRSFCKEKDPDFWLMGEIIHGDYTHWANPSMLDSVTNYECNKGLFSSHNDKNYYEIGYSLNRQFGNGGIYKNLCLYNFTDNHDIHRLASVLKNKSHMSLVYTLMYGMPGIPSIYYGSEWGIEGLRDDTSDYVLRPSLDLAAIPKADKSLCEHIGKLGTLYRQLRPLQYGSYEQIMLRNEQFVFARSENGETVYVALNLSDNARHIEFSAAPGTLVDILDGGNYVSNDGNYKLEMPAYASKIFVTPDLASKIRSGEVYQEPIVTSHQNEVVLTPITPEAISEAPVVERKQKVPAANAPLKYGRYQDSLGKEYQLIGIGKDEKTLIETVVYQELFGKCQLWVTPIDAFIAESAGEPRFYRVS